MEQTLGEWRWPVDRDLATVFANTRPDLSGLACNSQPMINQMTASSYPRHRYWIGEMHYREFLRSMRYLD